MYAPSLALLKLPVRAAHREDEDARQKRCDAELEFTTLCLKSNPKSYATWHQVCASTAAFTFGFFGGFRRTRTFLGPCSILTLGFSKFFLLLFLSFFSPLFSLPPHPSQRRWVLLNAPRPPWAKERALCHKFLTLDERNCASCGASVGPCLLPLVCSPHCQPAAPRPAHRPAQSTAGTTCAG